MKTRVLNLRKIACLVAFVMATMPLGIATGADALRESLANVATQLQKGLQLDEANGISIGQIVPKNGDPIETYRRRLSEALRAELEGVGVKVVAKSKLRIVGNYRVKKQEGIVSLSFTVVDDNGDAITIVVGNVPVATLDAEIRDKTELLLVSTTSLVVEPSESKPTVSLPEILDRVNEQKNKPTSLSIKGGYLMLTDVGLGMRLREVHPEFQTNDPQFLGAVVPANSVIAPQFTLNEKSSYAVDLISTRPDLDFATKVLFDGIDTFVLSDKDQMRADVLNNNRLVPKFEFWALERGKTQLISGWFKNLKKVSAFQIVPDERSVAFRLGRTEGIGTIQVIAHAAWPKGQAVPLHFKLPTPKGVGAGQNIQVDLRPVPFETGVVLGTICAEYEVNRCGE